MAERRGADRAVGQGGAGQVSLANLAAGARLRATLRLESKQVRSTKSGTPYLTVTLSDSTGSMRGVLFDYSVDKDTTEVGGAVSVDGVVEAFRGVPRIRIRQIEPAPSASADSLIRRATRPVADISREYGALVDSIADPIVREVVKRILRTDGLYRRLKVAPLEGVGYGAWIGGALEHSVRVARLVLSACETQPEIGRDLVLAAALLHQIGAVDATVASPRIQRTARGAAIPRGILSAMLMQPGLGLPENRTATQDKLEALVIASSAGRVAVRTGSGQDTPSLEQTTLVGAIEMAYSVGARIEAARSHAAPVVTMRRVS